MRVLLVNKFHWRKGGSETYYFSVGESLREMGHEVHYFSMADDRNEPCEDADCFVSRKDYVGRTSLAAKARAAATFAYSWEARGKFETLLRRVQPDIIHLNLVHHQITLSILDAPSARGIPVVFTAHDYILVCPNYLMRSGYGRVCDACIGGSYRHCVAKRCVKSSYAKSLLSAAEARFQRIHRSYDRIDCIIAPSEFMRDTLIRGGFSSSKIVMMRNFLHQRTSSGVPQTREGKRYFLYFGRLSHEKGVDLLVDAYLGMRDVLGDWELVVAGDGPERPKLELESSSRGAGVSFVGYMCGEELTRLVSGASFTIACSQWYENSPYSVIESLSVGTPVIGTSIGGIPEMVHDGVTGVLCEPFDSTSIGQALVKAAQIRSDKAAYASMRENCVRFVERECGQDGYVRRLVGLYRELIDGSAGNRSERLDASDGRRG